MDSDLDLIGKNRRPMHIIYAQRSVADPIYQTQQPSPVALLTVFFVQPICQN